MDIKIKRIRSVKFPNKAYSTDLGIDVYVPEIDKGVLDVYLEKSTFYNRKDVDRVILYFSRFNQLLVPQNSNVIIPSGLIIAVPKGYGLIAFNRSSVASKKGLILGACVIDYNYLEEVYINLINIQNNDVFLKGGEKIVQYVLVQNFDVNLIESDIPSGFSRGGFGSTGE